MKRHILIFGIVALIVVVLNMSAFATEVEDKEDGLTVDSELFEDEITKKLCSMSKEELLQFGNKMTRGNVTNDIMIAFPYALTTKSDEFTEQELLELVADTKNSETLRMLLTQFYTYKTEKSGEHDEEFKDLLYNEEIENSIKLSILSQFTFQSKDDEKILLDMVNQEDNVLSTMSLKRLVKVNQEKALVIASDILANYEKESEERVNNALSVQSSVYLRGNDISNYALNAKNDFKELCFSLLDNSLYMDNAAYALGNLFDFEAVATVINHEDIDYLTKVYVVNQNYSVLLHQLNEQIGTDELQTILNAMQILPIIDFYEPLSEILNTQEGLDESLIKQCEEILQIIKSEGIQANTNWLLQ